MGTERQRLETCIENQLRWIAEGEAEGNAAKVKRYKKGVKQSRRELRELSIPQSDTLIITVHTMRRSAKAIQVRVVEDHTGQMDGWSGWLPLSQSDYQERAMGPCDMVTLPGWLVKAKLDESN